MTEPVNVIAAVYRPTSVAIRSNIRSHVYYAVDDTLSLTVYADVEVNMGANVESALIEELTS